MSALPVDREKGTDTSTIAIQKPKRFWHKIPTGIGDSDEKKLIHKIDRRVIPGVLLLYLLSFLDRSNVANAKIEGLDSDLNMTGNQYLTGLTLFFIGYILFEVPCNIILKRTSPKFWLPTLTIIWGVVSTLQGITQSLAGFLVVRFFLGIAEGGLFPGIVFYLGFFYLRHERQYRVSLFFSAASLAGAFGGVLAYGIAHMNGIAGLEGWRWIFILEGILTVLVGFAAYFFICSYPETSKFLSEDEKARLTERLKADNDATPNESFTWSEVLKTFKDPKVWLYCAAFHTMSLPLYTLSMFLPTIIASLGYTSYQAQLLTVPPYVLATILTLAISAASERVHRRSPFAMISSAIAIIGYIILLANRDYHDVTKVSDGTTTKTPYYNHAGVSYLGIFFCAAGIYPATALALGWPAVNVSGGTKRATAGGLQITIGNLGAVIGTQLYRSIDSPRYVVGHSVALAYLSANFLVTATIWYYLKQENAKREATHAEDVGGEWEGDGDLRWRFQT